MSTKDKRRKRLRGGIYILPNLFTTAGIFCGFYSIISSLQGEFIIAAYAILAAGIFDMLDGRIARLTGSTSRFGAEYDSLADLTSFGLAPSLLAYTWALKPFDRLGWLAAFLYFACGALRLARYNARWDRLGYRYFEGLPIPLAAGVVAGLTLFHRDFISSGREGVFYVVLVMYVLACLMVSTVPYRSFKDLYFKRAQVFQALVMAVLMIVIVATYPQLTIFLVFSLYALSGPISLAYRKTRGIGTEEMSTVAADNEVDFN